MKCEICNSTELKTKTRNNKFGIKGICHCNGFYKCEIQSNKIRISLGQYKSLDKAIYCRKVAEEYLFGEYNYKNNNIYNLTKEEEKEVYYKTINKINLRINKNIEKSRV